MRSRSSLRAACFITIAAAVIGVSGTAVAADPATSIQTVQFDIPPQSLASALNALALQSRQQILFTPEIVKGKTTQGVKGAFTTEAALSRILAGTGLVVSRSAEGLILVSQADERGASASGPEADASLEEIVVTAQKRLERLQDVPVPVSSISAESLVRSNQLRLQDYYTRIPGLSVTPADTRGAPILAIRGVTTGGSLNPTVGVTIDDVPYGATTTFGGGFAAPDIDPSDLARIEVLRGPQGTLYGASSIGGLLKFVTVDPTTDAVKGQIQGGISSVRNGDGAGYNARGSVNVPLSESFALRASAFSRKDAGYIDNVLSAQDGVNYLDSEGGRLSALWRPSDALSVKLSALLQHATSHGASEVDEQAGLGDLEQSRVRGTGGFDKRVQAYNATATAKAGDIELTSLSGYSVNRSADSQDFTALLAPFTLDQFGVEGTPTHEHSKTSKFTQELRLGASIGPKFDWLAGAFYTHEKSDYVQNIFAADAVTGVRAGIWSNDVIPSSYEEYAAFADLTFHLNDRVDVQVGGRESENRQTYSEIITGPLDAILFPVPSPVVNPELHTKDRSFTYLVTPQFKVSPDLMLYARLASGYRPGGPNPTSSVYGVPASYKPDTTRNYEIGVKGTLFDRALSFDTSLYYIDWQDIQLTYVDPETFGSYFVNASHARSRGVELSAESRPFAGLSIAGWVAWNDAVLTRDIPVGAPGTPVGISGDRLPSSSRFSGNLSIEQSFALSAGVDGFIGATVSYVGAREGVFTLTEEREEFPAYAKTDVHAGVKRDSWTVNLYVTNLADRRGLLTGGVGTFVPTAFTYIQPRAVGVTFDKSF